MNRTFLVITSFLIALLGHLVFFNIMTFVFPDDPASLKPKFFFLGPILTQNDVRQATSKKLSLGPQTSYKTNLSARHLDHNITDEEKYPFAIGAIKKPLVPQTAEPQEKINLKSTFETEFTLDTEEEKEVQEESPPVVNIRPYRPLRFKTP